MKSKHTHSLPNVQRGRVERGRSDIFVEHRDKVKISVENFSTVALFLQQLLPGLQFFYHCSLCCCCCCCSLVYGTEKKRILGVLETKDGGKTGEGWKNELRKVRGRMDEGEWG